MSTTTIVLGDDHHVVRQGLRALFAGERDLVVTGGRPTTGAKWPTSRSA